MMVLPFLLPLFLLGQEAAPPEKKARAPRLRELARSVCQAEPLFLPKSPIARHARIDTKGTIRALRILGAKAWVFSLSPEVDRLSELEECLKEALPAGIQIWVRILLPTQGANAKPHLGDFEKWAREVARLSRRHRNLAAMILPELDYGRNPRYFHREALKELHDILNASACNLVAGLYDLIPEALKRFGGELDAVVVYYTNHKDLRNLAGYLAGARALSPKHFKIFGAFDAAPNRVWDEAPDPNLLYFCIRRAWKQVDGFFIRNLDLRPDSPIRPSKQGYSELFHVVRKFLLEKGK